MKRIPFILLATLSFASCGLWDDCELSIEPNTTELHCENTNYEYNQSRVVSCTNAADGYSIGQPQNGLIRNLQIDSVYCEFGVARVAASFHAHNDSTHWYDVEYRWLNSLSIGQSVDYALPTDTENNSLYYTIELTAKPNASHENQNSMTIAETRSYH